MHETYGSTLITRGAAKVAAGILACASLAGLGDSMPAAAHHTIAANHMTGAASAPVSPNLPTPVGLTECAAVSPESLANAEALAKEPTNPLVSQAAQAEADRQDAAIMASVQKRYPDTAALFAHTNLGDSILEATGQDYNQHHNLQNEDTFNYTVNAAVAKEKGVIVHDPRPFTTALENDIEDNKEPQLPFSTYLDAAKGYLALDGITLDIAAPGQQLAYNMGSPTPADTDTPRAKMDLFNLMEGIAPLPQQYIDLAGIHEITLGANQPDQPSYAAAYANLIPGGPIVFNLSTSESRDTIRHEAGHKVNAAACGGPYAFGNDPAFDELNHGQAYSGNTLTPSYPSAENFFDEPDVERLDTELAQAEETKNTTDAKALEMEMESKRAKITYITNYAETNMAEDNAEEIAAVTSDNWAVAFNASTPFVNDKSILELARIDQYNPGLAGYFAETAIKQDGIK